MSEWYGHFIPVFHTVAPPGLVFGMRALRAHTNTSQKAVLLSPYHLNWYAGAR